MSHLMFRNGHRELTKAEAAWPATPAFSLHQLEFFVDEVVRQKDKPVDVFNLAYAWDWATLQAERDLPLTEAAIGKLGHYVKPLLNPDEWWRPGPVILTPKRSSGQLGSSIGAFPNAQEVPYLMEKYVARLPTLDEVRVDTYPKDRMTPERAYRELVVSIHPFQDGNGRVGKIIYNWLKGTLRTPTSPPRLADEGASTEAHLEVLKR